MYPIQGPGVVFIQYFIYNINFMGLNRAARHKTNANYGNLVSKKVEKIVTNSLSFFYLLNQTLNFYNRHLFCVLTGAQAYYFYNIICNINFSGLDRG